MIIPGTSLVVQWLRLGLPIEEGVQIQFLVWELISHMPQGQQNQNIKKKQYCNKLNKNLKKKGLSFLFLLSLALFTSSMTVDKFLSLSELQMPHGVKWEGSSPLPAVL